MKDRTNQYAVAMGCSNCGQQVRMWFQKGTEVPTVAECPTCGCFQLRQMYGATSQCDKGNWFAQVCDTFFNGRKAS